MLLDFVKDGGKYLAVRLKSPCKFVCDVVRFITWHMSSLGEVATILIFVCYIRFLSLDLRIIFIFKFEKSNYFWNFCLHM